MNKNKSKFSTKEGRRLFRMSKEWTDFRRKVRRIQSTDCLTGEKLRRDWNLHHMDLRVDNYASLELRKFSALNMDTHKFVHWLYRLWQKDSTFVFRLQVFLSRMAVMSGAKKNCMVTHNKTGNTYYVVGPVIDCTNARDGSEMILYCNDVGSLFVRDAAEFDAKFTQRPSD